MDLLYAAKNGDIGRVSELLDHDADINTRDKNGDTALILALWEEQIDVVRLLIERGADTNIRGSDHDYTALMIAIQYKNIDIIRLLLDRGANPNISSVYGDTPLIYASFGGRTDIVRLLLRYGANPNIQNRYGETALDKAVQFEYDDIAELIHDHIKLQRVQQNLAFASSLNPRLGYDTLLNDLDHDTMKKVLEYDRRYDPEINIRMLDESRRDKLTKSLQRLASMRSMHSREGPFGSIRYDPSIMEDISRHLSRIGPIPSVQERLMLEDRQTGSGRRRRRRRSKQRKKYTYNRFY